MPAPRANCLLRKSPSELPWRIQIAYCCHPFSSSVRPMLMPEFCFRWLPEMTGLLAASQTPHFRNELPWFVAIEFGPWELVPDTPPCQS
eukprot:scaffold17137_cov22-Cyclotella_meneghiniana.AAC.1